MTDPIDRIRRFNRFYLQHMGFLSRDYLGTGLGLTDLRILYDISDGSADTARDLARRLSLDEGYLSRVLSRFVRQGLVARKPSPEDSRRKTLAMTAAGFAYVEALVERMRAALAGKLSDVDPEAVAEAAGHLETLLQPPDPASVEIRDIASGDIGWLTLEHARYYSRTYGFDMTFEALVAEILSEFSRTRDPGRERAFIAESGGRRLGSVLCVRSGVPGTAQLRLFYLVPEARGLGLGRRLVEEFLGFARAAGYARVVLWTHESHREAGRLYSGAGFRLTKSEPARSFGTDQVVQSWEREL